MGTFSIIHPEIGTRFGKNVLVGVSRNHYFKWVYMHTCDSCSLDKELFPGGVLESSRAAFIRGGELLCCPCNARQYRWTQNQYEIRVRRILEKSNSQFVKFDKDFTITTGVMCTLNCSEHGEWSTRLNVLLSRNPSDCPHCNKSKNKENVEAKNDPIHIKEFWGAGVYPEGTEFSRSRLRDQSLNSTYWDIFCPSCSEVRVAQASAIKSGRAFCQTCHGRQRPQAAVYSYINVFEPEDALPVLKYGVSYDPRVRLKDLRRYMAGKSTMYNLLCFEFTSAEECLAAENECKMVLASGVITKNQLANGHTETTKLMNLVQIIEIFQSHGGGVREQIEENSENVTIGRFFDKYRSQMEMEIADSVKIKVMAKVHKESFLTEDQRLHLCRALTWGHHQPDED